MESNESNDVRLGDNEEKEEIIEEEHVLGVEGRDESEQEETEQNLVNFLKN